MTSGGRGEVSGSKRVTVGGTGSSACGSPGRSDGVINVSRVLGLVGYRRGGNGAMSVTEFFRLHAEGCDT